MLLRRNACVKGRDRRDACIGEEVWESVTFPNGKASVGIWVKYGSTDSEPSQNLVGIERKSWSSWRSKRVVLTAFFNLEVDD